MEDFKIKKSNSDEEFYVGVAIGGTKTSVLLGTNGGEIYKSETFLTKPHYLDVLKDIEKIADTYFSAHTIVAIGVTSGGPLDTKKGIIKKPPNLLSWDNVNIIKHFREKYNVDCFLENDANAEALAEWYWGNGQGCENLLYLTFGTGMGSGMILNNALYTGSSSLAGEIGHIRLADEGPMAYDKHGSWESFCSGSGLSRLYTYLGGKEPLDAQQICDLAEENDELGSKTVELSSTYLGKGVAMLIDIFNPDKIIIGSIFTRREALFRASMEKEIASEALYESQQRCEVVTAKLGNRIDEKGTIATVIYHLRKNTLGA